MVTSCLPSQSHRYQRCHSHAPCGIWRTRLGDSLSCKGTSLNGKPKLSRQHGTHVLCEVNQRNRCGLGVVAVRICMVIVVALEVAKRVQSLPSTGCSRRGARCSRRCTGSTARNVTISEVAQTTWLIVTRKNGKGEGETDD